MYAPVRDDNGNIVTEIRPSDGYVNATRLCQSVGKQWKHYNENKSTKSFFRALSYDLASSEPLIQYAKKCPTHERHTWVHPRIATHLACWISSEFTAKLTGWIEIARERMDDVKKEYDEGLRNLKADDDIESLESTVRDRLCAKMNGTIEVPGLYGPIDIVTDEQVIEVKHVSMFTRALGQILGHSMTFPEKSKRLHLFGSDEELRRYLEMAKTLCDKYDVTITSEATDT